MIEKVKRMLGLGKKKPSNLLLINCEKLERRVALLEDGQLEEYTVERTTDRNIVGGIFKGKVRNIEPGLKAMFVDIGFEKTRSCTFGTPCRAWMIPASNASNAPKRAARNPARKSRNPPPRTFPRSTRSAAS